MAETEVERLLRVGKEKTRFLDVIKSLLDIPESFSRGILTFESDEDNEAVQLSFGFDSLNEIIGFQEVHKIIKINNGLNKSVELEEEEEQDEKL